MFRVHGVQDLVWAYSSWKLKGGFEYSMNTAYSGVCALYTMHALVSVWPSLSRITQITMLRQNIGALPVQRILVARGTKGAGGESLKAQLRGVLCRPGTL